MKNNRINYIIVFGIFLFLMACSTKKDNFANRNFQALNTKYNVLFNGGVALDKGIADVKKQYNDNYWEILPIERQQPPLDKAKPEQTKNANFDRAETKATKAIQKRSMNIDGTERNYQIDEAYLMLGQSRYYDQRFVPALEAFNYILYKYPKSDKINVAKIWREKTNIRLDNDEIAIENLNKLLKDIKLKDQVFADANAILAHAYLKTSQKDSAVVRLRQAIRYTKQNEERARYRFIIGQLYEDSGLKDSAFVSYQSVIDMKRKSPRVYVIHSQMRQASQFDYAKGDTVAFVKKFKDLLKDRENRPFLDAINHQMGLFYDKQKNYAQAKKYYNKSIRARSADTYLEASNFRNLADIYFYEAKYVTAGKYYDTTMTKLNNRTREFKLIKKKRENLDDVIKYEGIAQQNDSILKLIAMSDSDRTKYFEDYIVKLKESDARKKEVAEKTKADGVDSKESLSKDDPKQSDIANAKKSGISSPIPSPSGNEENVPGDFYFYNPSTVAFGKAEFRKNWGDRTLKENWRTSATASKQQDNNQDATTTETDDKTPDKTISKEENRYTVNYYMKQIPKKQDDIDLLKKDRNFAYYQLGVIYKDKFKENKLAENKFESLLIQMPEERLILPSMYNLYLIYVILGNKEKADQMKADIIKVYPDSRYAQILGNTNAKDATTITPEAAYQNLYKEYKSGEYRSVYKKVNAAIDQYTGEEIVSKFELLKANNIGKIKGLVEFKKNLNFVALNYPNSPEGKDAEAFLKKDIPAMEALQFNLEKPMSWKIIYRIGDPEDKKAKALLETINKFIKDRTSGKLTSSVDLYTMDENFIVIHGIKTEEGAKGIESVLKEFKEYKIKETAIVISNDNYKIVQIKKNLEEYLADPKKAPIVKAPPVVPTKPNPKPVPKPGAAPGMPQNPKGRTQPSLAPPSTPDEPDPSAQPTEQPLGQPMQDAQPVKKRI